MWEVTTEEIVDKISDDIDNYVDECRYSDKFPDEDHIYAMIESYAETRNLYVTDLEEYDFANLIEVTQDWLP
jgi:hypothetical protein